MNDPVFVILGVSSIVIYLSTIGFFWGVYHENCSALNRSVIGKNFDANPVEFTDDPVKPDFREFLQKHWKPLAIFGIIYSGMFGFFIEHVCHYT